MNLATENANISIMDHGEVVSINCSDVLDYHTGNAWFGVAIAFRALEVAANAFKNANQSWDRSQLTIVSAHPGPGVKDTIEYITHSISNQRFRLTDECSGLNSCSSSMRFSWWVSNDTHTVFINLRRSFIPTLFNELLDRLDTIHENGNDQQIFKQLQQDLANNILQQPLLDNFNCDLYPGPIAPEQLLTENLDQ